MKAEIGTSVHLPSAKGLLDAIVHAESVAIPAFWLTTGAGPDALTVFAAAAPATRSIRMGTAVVPTFPRNPVVVAQQSLDIASIAPGRLRLGLGPSHAPTIQNRYGLPYERPLEHLREFVAIVKGLLAGGTVRFAGRRYTLEATLSSGADVPIMVSALRAGSFELAGEITDGAITWLCPARYIRDVGMPAMARGAERAGRARPPMIGQVFLALTESEADLHAAVERGLTYYPRLPNYQEMFAAAGLPEAREGRWSQAMINATVIHGDETACAAKLDAFIETAGCEHLIVSVLATGSDQQSSIRRSLDLIGRYATAR